MLRSLRSRKRKRNGGNGQKNVEEHKKYRSHVMNVTGGSFHETLNYFDRPRQDLGVHRDGAMQRIRNSKIDLIKVLVSDPGYILQHVQADSIITQREYNIINSRQKSGEDTVIDILDKIMNKGEDACRRFLDLLQTDDIQETFPGLKGLICSNVPKHDKKEIAEISKYPMTRIPRGKCVIFNNENFISENLKRRKGSQKDAARLCQVFKWLGFDVQMVKDQSANEMRALLRDLGQQVDGQCFVCCVLSHGTQQGVYGRDGKVLGIGEILQPFRATCCPALVGRPKVFFIQACQGMHMQEAMPAECDVDLMEHESDAAGAPSGTIPCDADFLVGMATVQDCVSLRDPKDGSWYIQSLCRMLEQGCPRGEDILTILTRVNEEVSGKAANVMHNGEVCLAKQIPEPKYTLTKRLVLGVPKSYPL